MTVRLVVCVLTLVLNVYGQNTCVRPDGQRGMCVKYNHCPEILAKMAQSKNPNLKDYTCGYVNNIPMVCCDDCYTPEGNLGKCKHVNTCPNLAALANSSDQNLRAFLRNSRCLTGPFDVCCGPSPAEVRQSDDCNREMTAFPPHPASRCCGYDVSAGSRITGGTDTGIDEYPWTVLLEYEKMENGRVEIKTYCGGSLISNRYVVTAAHCIIGGGAWPPKNVRLGEYDTRTDKDCVDTDCAESIKVIRIEEIIVHPQYSIESKQNDIALLRMASPVAFSDFVRPICLPSINVSKRQENLEVVAAGWGRINLTHRSPIKQHVKLPLLKLEDCITRYSRVHTVTKPNLWKKQLCAGGEPGKDACRGDSGGPLILKTGLLHEMVGLVSYGSKYCGTEGQPGIYTHVFPYTVWIRANIRP